LFLLLLAGLLLAISSLLAAAEAEDNEAVEEVLVAIEHLLTARHLVEVVLPKLH
tara:strand:- start:591 stop:752 length:162 start_codon:yes stop_codon:yes gene_type:complete